MAARMSGEAARPERYRSTVRDFIALEEAGAFAEHDRRLELIDGELLWLFRRTVPHGRAGAVLVTEFGNSVRAVAPSLALLAPMSAHLSDHDMPEVDLIVATACEEPFVTPATALLFLELAAESLDHDLGPKLRLYARTGVPEYWVADVNGRRIIRFHAPAGEEYAQRAEFAFGDAVPSATIPNLTVDTARLA